MPVDFKPLNILVRDKLREIRDISSYAADLLQKSCIDDGEELMEKFMEDLPRINELVKEILVLMGE